MSAALSAEVRAARVLSADDYRKYLPIVRRTAMRVARKVPAHITVADLTGYAWVGLVEAFARSTEEMSDLLELITAWCVQNGIDIDDSSEGGGAAEEAAPDAA